MWPSVLTLRPQTGLRVCPAAVQLAPSQCNLITLRSPQGAWLGWAPAFCRPPTGACEALLHLARWTDSHSALPVPAHWPRLRGHEVRAVPGCTAPYPGSHCLVLSRSGPGPSLQGLPKRLGGGDDTPGGWFPTCPKSRRRLPRGGGGMCRAALPGGTNCSLSMVSLTGNNKGHTVECHSALKRNEINLENTLSARSQTERAMCGVPLC